MPNDRYQTMDEALAELEPVWKRYLQSDISILLENSKRLYQDGDLMAAKSEIIQILAWDPTNTQAKGLADRISTDVRREQLSEQLKERIDNARRLFAEGRHEEAKSEAEAALKLDSSFVPAQEMLSQVRETLDQTREIDLAIETSRQKMGEGALTEAETQLEKAFAIDPDNPQAQDQRKQLQQERANRERRKHREALLENARSLSANLQYDKCVELLLTARAQFPGDHEILQLLDAARRDQVRNKEKQDLLKQRVREVERMIDRQALTEAIDLARQTITTVGPEPRLSDILATAQREVEFREQKKQEQEQRLQMVRTLLADGRVDEASWAAKEALDTRLFAETDPRIAKLLEEIAGKRKSATSGSGSSGGLGVLGNIFPAGTKSDPGKSDPAKDYVYVRGVEPPKPPATTVERNISAAAGVTGAGISGTGASSVSGISGATGSGAGQGSSIAGVTSSAFDPGWQDREKSFLTAVEKQLAAHVGPIAAIVTSRTAAKVNDPVELIMQLASTLHVEADRKAFLARKNDMLHCLTRPVAASPPFDTQTMTRLGARTPDAKPTAPPVALTPAGIRHAGELLARYLGPVAKILAERAASRAASEQALYSALAEHLQDPAERARFLRDAGFPQS